MDAKNLFDIVRRTGIKVKVALLYLCSGEYKVLWDDYYKSFMENFLPDCEKDFYVFTDAANIPYEEKGNVYVKKNPYVGWPIGTLKRFELFLSIKHELISRGYAYLFFCNANLRCIKVVHQEDLTIDNDAIKLIVAKHPAYENKKVWRYPYDRNPKCTAYIPYNCGKFYVMGSFNGGKTEDYLQMAEILNNNENIDESNHVMAKVFDESHLNYYITQLNEKNVKVLSSAYCSDYRAPQDKIIMVMENKAEYFNEDAIKRRKKRSFILVWFDKGARFICSFLHFIMDSFWDKKICSQSEMQKQISGR